MAFRRGLSAEQEEQLLAGRPDGDAGWEEVAAFTQALSAALIAPDTGSEPSFVSRLAEEAQASAAGGIAGVDAGGVAGPRSGRGGAAGRIQARIPRFIPRSRLVLVARVATAVLLLPAAMAALAFAGVTLPDPAQEAFDRVGIDLPNQSAVDEDADAADGDGIPAPEGPKAGAPPAGAKKGADKGQNGDKPGRRVRRHGEGPVPGPANPPEGLALEYSKSANPGATADSQATSRGRSGTAPRGKGRNRGRN